MAAKKYRVRARIELRFELVTVGSDLVVRRLVVSPVKGAGVTSAVVGRVAHWLRGFLVAAAAEPLRRHRIRLEPDAGAAPI